MLYDSSGVKDAGAFLKRMTCSVAIKDFAYTEGGKSHDR
jgi:hypothetical protein